MNKGCDKMNYGTCQFYKEHIASHIKTSSNGTVYSAPMEYSTYCTSFDNFENCPYYSYRNFNNQPIRNQYKKNNEDYAKGNLIATIIIIVIIAFFLKRCGVL